MLIGETVCLGPILAGDAPKLFNWLNTLGLAHCNGAYRPMDEGRFNGWLAGFSDDPGRVIFAIRRQGDLRLMGYLQLTGIDPVARAAELGVLIGDAADRGHGFGQAALSLAIRFCWRDLNLRRLGLSVIGDNPRAIAAYARTGFEIEGVRRQAAYVDGRFVDVTVMGLLRGDG